jgi:hypothetical protein
MTMHKRKILIASFFFCLASAVSANDNPMANINFTGPLLTPNAAALPKGMLSIEPYLFFAESDSFYDAHGDRHAIASGSQQRQMLVPASYGITDRLTGFLTFGASHTSSDGHRSTGAQITDTTVKLQYMLQAPSADGVRPAISVAFSHGFATGPYDRLDANPLNGAGSGAVEDTFSLSMQGISWLPNGRPLRWRTYLAWTPSPPRIVIDGMSVYGTPHSFHGNAALGQTFDLSTSFEYSIDQHWVLAMELHWDHEGGSQLRGFQRNTSDSYVAIDRDDLSCWIYSVAPAVEYNFNDRFGLIAGAQISVAGHNSAYFATPQVALNMVF